MTARVVQNGGALKRSSSAGCIRVYAKVEHTATDTRINRGRLTRAKFGALRAKPVGPRKPRFIWKGRANVRVRPPNKLKIFHSFSRAGSYGCSRGFIHSVSGLGTCPPPALPTLRLCKGKKRAVPKGQAEPLPRSHSVDKGGAPRVRKDVHRRASTGSVRRNILPIYPKDENK